MALHGARGKLIGVIGDEDTCVGFLLGGIGELNKNREPNFLVVDKNTPLQDIEDTVKGFMKRSDISIILINQNIAEMVGFNKVIKEDIIKSPRFATSLMHTQPQSLRYWRFPAKIVLMTPTRIPFSGGEPVLFCCQLNSIFSGEPRVSSLLMILNKQQTNHDVSWASMCFNPRF